jgi:hypothetical protein
LGIPAAQVIESLYDSLSDNSDSNLVITRLNDLLNQGYQAAIIAKSLGKLIRSRLIAHQFHGSDQQALTLLSDLILVSASVEPDRSLEIAILKYKLQSDSKPLVTTPIVNTKQINKIRPDQKISQLPAENSKVGEVIQEQDTPQTQSKNMTTETATAISNASDTAPSSINELPIDEFWPKALAALKQKYNTLYGIVRMAQPRILPENDLELQFKFAFHQKRVMESKNQQILRAILKEITGQDYKITCVTDTTTKTEVPSENEKSTLSSPQEGADFLAISNIFGGGELLES